MNRPKPQLKLSKRTLELSGVLIIILFVSIKDALLVPATGLTKHGVNVVSLLAIDEGTIPTLVIGQEWLSRPNASRTRRLVGLLLAGVSYAAPYAYIAIAIEKAPNVIGSVLSFALLTGTIIVIRHLLRHFQKAV